MKALAINFGSSSLKYKLFEYESEEELFSNKLNINPEELVFAGILKRLEQDLIDNHKIQNFNEISVVIHRVVHGGEEFNKPAEISEETLNKIQKYNEFAPLHNPNQLEFIKTIYTSNPRVKQYAVFDTTFNLTVPQESYLYGLPYGYYENLKIRKYGFHGIAHKSINLKLQELEGTNEFNHISCHLGAGSSVCAIKEGKAIFNSFGFTPDENILMATRAGEVDYDAVAFIKKQLGLSEDDIRKLLNFESGLLGISGYTNDMKKLLADYELNPRAKLAVDMYIDSVTSYVYISFMKLDGEVDILTFSGGIGAGSDVIRAKILDKLKPFNVAYFDYANTGKIDVVNDVEITHPESEAKIFIMDVDEGLQMLHDVKAL